MLDEPTSPGATLLAAPASTRPTDLAPSPDPPGWASEPVPADPSLILLAEAVADHGVAAHEADVQRLIERARGRGMRSGALQALEDRSAADVVRARALAVVLSQLRRSGGV